jgi:hypothetical protein
LKAGFEVSSPPSDEKESKNNLAGKTGERERTHTDLYREKESKRERREQVYRDREIGGGESM